MEMLRLAADHHTKGGVVQRTAELPYATPTPTKGGREGSSAAVCKTAFTASNRITTLMVTAFQKG